MFDIKYNTIPKAEEVKMKIKTNPNVIPLCDILLVLLIVFMLITPLSQYGIDSMVPDIEQGREPQIVLSIKKDGSVNLNSENYSNLDNLEKRLIEIYQYRIAKIISIQAHEKISYKDVIKVLDIAKGAGVEKIYLIPRKNF
jgi:biopolymer transport protein ExbD